MAASEDDDDDCDYDYDLKGNSDEKFGDIWSWVI
jgi:hypothetical protein